MSEKTLPLFLLSYLCCNFQITSSAKINFISTADYYKLPIFKDLYACNNSYRLSMQITQNHISFVSRRINDSWEQFGNISKIRKEDVYILIHPLLLSLEGNGCQIYYKAILNFIVHTHILQEYFYFIFLSLLTLRLFLCKLTS